MKHLTSQPTKMWKYAGRMFPSVLFTLLLILSGFVGKTQNVVNIGFNPSATNVIVSQTFNVEVAVDVASGSISGIDAYINFDRNYLEVVTDPVPNPALNATLPNTSVSFASVATMNSTGQIDYGRFTLSPTNHPNADFVFFTVQFRAIAIPPGGTTNLVFNTNGVRITNAVEGVEPDVMDVISNGTVTITSASCTLPTAVINNSAVACGAPVNLLLQSATGTGPWDLTINGTTYNNITVGSTITSIAYGNESLFTPSTTPAVLVNNDGPGPITVGTRIRSDVAGVVKALRFYRGVDDGTYTGYLYNNDGSMVLGSVVFPSGGANGWQQASLSSAVTIAPNTNYVVAVTSSNGFYSVSEFFFNSAQTNGSHLTGPQNPGPGPNANGVYTYGTGFPGDTYNSGCYFTDVVFQPTELTFNLTSVTDESPCTNTGAPLQTLTVNLPVCSTVPVTLMNFSASASGSNAIRLNWATASEQDNKGFEIRRSLTGQGNWETIAFVNGAGESNTIKTYSYLDQNLAARRYFYQLNQVDFDERSKLSSVVSANLNSKDVFSLEQNFPNPFKGQETTIRFTLPHRSQTQLIVYDMNGRVVKTLVNGVKDAGTYVIPFQDNSLPTGVYFYKLTADGMSDVKKMTIR